MQYIKSIKSQSGIEGSYMLYYLAPVGWEFELSDSGIVDIRGVTGQSGVLGFSASMSECCMVVVKHSVKEAKLYKYIKSAETKYNTYAIPGNWDSCIVSGDGIESVRFVGGSTIAIDTEDIAIEVCGELGSVCLRSPSKRVTPEVFNLYGLLGTLCKELGINLFKYHSIMLYSDLRCYATTIKLSTDVEAMRFFSKMALDISGRDRVGFERSEGLLLI